MMVLRVRVDGEREARDRDRKPAVDRRMPVGAVWEPRLKSQRSEGREREAGCERRIGMSKPERAAIPPLVKRAVGMVRSWRACVVVMVS